MLVSNPLGILVSFVIQAIYGVRIAEQQAKVSDQTAKNQVVIDNTYSLLFYESVMTTLMCAYFWVVFRTSRPETPPSLAATRRQASITQGMCNDMKILFGNRNYLLVLVCFSLVYSVYGAFGFVINPLLEPVGY